MRLNNFKLSSCLIAILALGALAAQNRATEEVDISGRYVCQGKTPENQTYRGSTVITKTRDTYQVAWSVGGDVYFGEGIRQGDFLSVCWVLSEPTIPGIMVYHIQKGPKLAGKWAVMGGQGTVLPEALTFVGRAEDKALPKPKEKNPQRPQPGRAVDASFRRPSKSGQ